MQDTAIAHINKLKAIFIAGLTASGKSQLAIDIAAKLEKLSPQQKNNAIIINADSMQVYDGLQILTARPSAEDIAKTPHYLYGCVKPSNAFSTGAWLKAVKQLISQPDLKHKIFIFVGGTGLYFKALLGDLAQIPEVSVEVKQQAHQLLNKNGLESLYQDLEQNDPKLATKIGPKDTQRILRAWEVWKQTSKPLSFWQTQKQPALFNSDEIAKIVLLPHRDVIYQRINARVDKMLEQEVLAEITTLLGRKLSPQLPVMKAAGLREFSAYLDNQIDLITATEKAKQETRRYAKRQRTWFNNQLDKDWQKLENPAEFDLKLLAK